MEKGVSLNPEGRPKNYKLIYNVYKSYIPYKKEI